MNIPRMRSSWRFGALIFGLAFSTLAPQAHSRLQDSLWSSIFHKPGVSGQIYTTLQVGDLLYVGGKFNNMVGGTNLRHIAIYDLTNKCWIDPGADFDASSFTEVRSIKLDSTDGTIIIGGYFTQIGGNSNIQHIARYNGISWSTLSGSPDGLNNTVYDIITTDSATYLGGWFTTAGGLAVSGVARWRPGVGWDDIDGGVRKNFNASARVYALGMTSFLYVAGSFDSAGVNAASNLAQFTGSEWLSLGGGTNHVVYAMFIDRQPLSGVLRVAVGGSFTKVGDNIDVSQIALYLHNSGEWFDFPGANFNNIVRAITYFPGSGYIAGGDFVALGADTLRHLAAYVASESLWVSIGEFDATVHSLNMEQGDLMVGGSFFAVDSQIVSGLTRTNLFDGWETFGMGANSLNFNKDIRSVAVDTAGLVYVGGTFERIGNAYAYAIATWDGQSWSAFDAVPEPGGHIQHVTFINDTLYVGGQFQMLGSDAIRSIAKWDGQNWIALGSGLNGNVFDIVKGSDGNIYAAGDFANPNHLLPGAFARWDGSAWQYLFNSQAEQLTNLGGVYDLLATTDGGIYFGGSFGFGGQTGLPWDTASSISIAFFHIFADSSIPLYRPDSNSVLPTIRTMIYDIDGSLLIGGDGPALYKDIATAWIRYALCFEPRAMALSNNGLFIGGLDRLNNCGTIIRREGVAFQSLGSGVQQFNQAAVLDLAVNGQDLWVVGDFEMAGAKPASNISRWTIEERPDTSTVDKKLIVRAFNSLVLASKSFTIYKVFNNRPDYSQTFVGTAFSDGLGQIDLSGYLTDGTISIGDTLRISRVVHTEPSLKHQANQYSIELDNMKFDTLGDVSFNLVLDNSMVQLVTLDHTTLLFNLVVSLEWDATLDFLQKTESCFRKFSNYLYDVSDGQMRLDTVYVSDNKNSWEVADIHINASNMVWPHVSGVGGIANEAGRRSYPIEMPRVHVGGPKGVRNRNDSYNDYQLDISDPASYRTFVHEFGHYGLSLFDEYRSRDPQDEFVHCASFSNYGFMESNGLNDGVYSSEMSIADRYADEACQNTKQWQVHKASCWEVVEKAYQRTYGGVPIPIYRPDERALPVGLDYLPGPLDNATNLSYDAGARVVFPVTMSAPSASDLEVVFTLSGGVVPILGIPAINVWSVDLSSFVETYQGLTSDGGKIWALGVTTPGTIRASGYYEDMTVGRLAGSAAAPPRKWLYGEAAIGVTDSLHMPLEEVQGDHNLVSKIDPISGGISYTLFSSQPFSSEPLLEHMVGGSAVSSEVFSATTNGYTVTLSDSLRSEGKFRIQAPDDSGATFFFPVRYTIGTPDSSGTFELTGPEGASALHLDSSAATLSQVLLSSTAYPVLRNGLDPSSVQAGEVHTLGFLPGGALVGDHFLILSYSESNLGAAAGPFGDESQLRVFRWNETTFEWELRGGYVDTTLNEVSVAISEPGTYALFTTDIQTDVNDNGTGSVLPKRFELHQNYPNPFNPSTKISFSLPTTSQVKLKVYNILGQEVATLYEGRLGAGVHSYEWDGRTVASGVYLYRLTAGDYSESRKMMLLK